MALPTDAATRKKIPVYTGFIKYFPDAMAAVAQLSLIANEQHSPGEPMHWAKDKSDDELDSLMRHMLDDAGLSERDVEGVLHATKVAWRGMANLQRLADDGVNIFAVLNEATAEDDEAYNVMFEDIRTRRPTDVVSDWPGGREA